jgi:hypothetical protein
LLRSYYHLKDQIWDYFFPNRAFNPSALADWAKTEAEIQMKLWSGLDRVHWYCPELFVNLKYQNTGYSQLLKWGFGRGIIDEVKCFAGCQMNQVALYEAEGMEKVTRFRCGPSQGMILSKI